MTPLPDSEPYRPPEPAFCIRRVRIRNFKSIQSADVALAPLTILVGRNGSGKSNFLDALRYVAENNPITLVGIEEPETALHPAAAGALMDALLARERSPSFDKLCRELAKRLAGD